MPAPGGKSMARALVPNACHRSAFIRSAFSVSYMFDFAGGVRRTVERQDALAAYQAHEVDAAALSVSGNVAQQALAIAAAQAQIESLEAVLADDQSDLKLVQDAFESGSASRVDVLNAQSQSANDQTLLLLLRRELSNAQHALAVLLGRSPAGWSAPEFKLDEFVLPQQLPDALPSELAHRRPGHVWQPMAQLHAATAAVWALRRPTCIRRSA